MKKRILVVEDDEHLALGLRINLELEGYEPVSAPSAEEALLFLRKGGIDLVLLDVMLPGMNGFELCRRIRAERLRVPVLFLTARGAEEDRVRGLEEGGDDYMVKPFSFSELLVRIQALLRRSQRTPQSTVLQVADLRLNLTDRTAERGGEAIELQPREFGLLEYLMRNPGRVITKTAILEHVYDYSFDPQTNVVDVLVCRLRNRIDKPFDQKLIHTVRGVGYVLKEDG